VIPGRPAKEEPADYCERPYVHAVESRVVTRPLSPVPLRTRPVWVQAGRGLVAEREGAGYGDGLRTGHSADCCGLQLQSGNAHTQLERRYPPCLANVIRQMQ
jgi:hypothetical protein